MMLTMLLNLSKAGSTCVRVATNEYSELHREGQPNLDTVFVEYMSCL